MVCRRQCMAMHKRSLYIHSCTIIGKIIAGHRMIIHRWDIIGCDDEIVARGCPRMSRPLTCEGTVDVRRGSSGRLYGPIRQTRLSPLLYLLTVRILRQHLLIARHAYTRPIDGIHVSSFR